MGRLLLIDVAGSVAVLGLWYVVFSTYNRKKGAAALRWVQTACAGKGRVLDVVPSAIHERHPVYIGSREEVTLADEMKVEG